MSQNIISFNNLKKELNLLINQEKKLMFLFIVSKEFQGVLQ